ncbi:NnrS family protein [Poseidonibacter sp.]|uniref:NnrS family protein n=1 Tax=Poseidonibacter sp. TaxID=2321188 RepID=UPI003C78A83D
MFSNWYKKFSSQPHQPFFTSGIIFFILFMTLFLFSYLGFLNLDKSILSYHAYSMIFVIFIQFFLGFLFVVFPKFLSQAEIKVDNYMKLFHLYLFSSLGIFLSLIFYSQVTIIFQVLMFIAQILSFKLLYSIHKKSIVANKDDTKWVLISFFSGLISHALFIISNFDFNYSHDLARFSINAGFYLFLFGIIFTISQRMIPFFTKAKVFTYIVNKSKNLVLIVFSLLALKVILLSFQNASINLLADVPLFIIFVRELIKWKLPLFKVPAIMWVLYLGLYWIPFAFLLSILESVFYLVNTSFIFEKAVIHSLALGYFLTVLIGFGTRVILGHSGSTPHASSFAIVIFVLVQIVAFLRLFASFSINTNLDYIFFLNLSALLLICGLIIWSIKYLTILLKGK